VRRRLERDLPPESEEDEIGLQLHPTHNIPFSYRPLLSTPTLLLPFVSLGLWASSIQTRKIGESTADCIVKTHSFVLFIFNRDPFHYAR